MKKKLRLLVFPLLVLTMSGVAFATVGEEVVVCRYEKTEAQLLIAGPEIIDSGEIPGYGDTTVIGGWYDEGNTRTFIMASAEQTEVYCPPDSKNFHIDERSPEDKEVPAPAPAPTPQPTPAPVAPIEPLPDIQGK